MRDKRPRQESWVGTKLPVDCLLTLMPFGNSTLLSRREIVKIAQRFNAGLCRSNPPSPEGTKESWFPKLDFYRPFGTRLFCRLNPALKRWAIVECPSGPNVCPNSRNASGLKPTKFSPVTQEADELMAIFSFIIKCTKDGSS